MSIEIRALREGELRKQMTVVERAFAEEMTDEAFGFYRPLQEEDRTLVALDGEVMVGGAAAISFRLSMPGGEMSAAGVTGVGVVPTHRRRGILTQLMRRQLDDVRERGEPAAILWASEGSIYQRYGYGLASMVAAMEIPQRHATFRTHVDPVGAISFVTPEQAVTSFPPIFDAVRAVTPGFLSRTPTWWQAMVADPSFNRRGAGPKFLLLFEVDGAPEGYLIYRVKGEWENGATKSTLEVRELMAMTTRAERELWRFCFGHDLILTVRAQHRAVDDPLLLQLNEPRRLRATLGDGLWLRIVDIPGALAARGYLAADALTFDLSDGFIPDLAGRWRLDTRGDAVAVARTDEPAELALDITDLGALSLGAFSATDLARSDRVRELRPGALHRADGLFGWHRRPWCAEVF